MAVIRQQTQVFNKPVGVRRINTGEAELWETIKKQADEFTRRAYNDAAENAQKVGGEMAMGADVSSITTLDPLTGRPKAMETPEGMGSIAEKAYRNVITQRYEDSIKDEMNIRAQELALRYQYKPEEYAVAMSQHIASMAENADGMYKTFIEVHGSKQLASNKLSLQKELRDKVRLDAGNSIIQKSKAAVQTVTDFGKAGNITALEEMMEVIEENVANYQNGEASNLLKAGSAEAVQTELEIAGVSGYVSTLLNNTKNPIERSAIITYISTGGVVSEHLDNRTKLRLSYIKDYLDVNTISSVTVAAKNQTNVMDSTYNKVEAKKASDTAALIEQKKSEMAQILIQNNVAYGDKLQTLRMEMQKLVNNIGDIEIDERFGRPTGQTLDTIRGPLEAITEHYTEQAQKLLERRAAPYTKYTESMYKADLVKLRESLLRPMIIKIAGISEKEGNLEYLKDAIYTGDAEALQRLTPVQQVLVQTIRSTPVYNPDDDRQYINNVIKDGTNLTEAKVAEENAKLEILDYVQKQSASAGNIYLTNEALGEIDANLKSQIGMHGYTSSDYKRDIKQIRSNAAVGIVQEFGKTATYDEFLALIQYVETASGPNKTGDIRGMKSQEEISRGERIIKLLGDNDSKELIRRAGSIKVTIKNQQDRAEKIEKDRLFKVSVSDGTADRTSTKVRKAVDGIFADKNLDVSDIFTYSDNIQKGMFQQLVKAPSEKMVNALKQIASGVGHDNAETYLNLFIELDNFMDGDAQLSSRLSDVMSATDLSRLDHIHRASQFTDQSINQIAAEFSKLERVGTEKIIEERLGGKNVYEFTSEITKDPLLTSDLIPAVKLSMLRGDSPEMIKSFLQNYVDKKYLKSEYVLDPRAPNGEFTRSQYSLDSTFPDLGEKHAFLNQVETYLSDISIPQGKNSVGKQLPNLEFSIFSDKAKRVLSVTTQAITGAETEMAKKAQAFLIPDLSANKVTYLVYYKTYNEAGESEGIKPLITQDADGNAFIPRFGKEDTKQYRIDNAVEADIVNALTIEAQNDQADSLEQTKEDVKNIKTRNVTGGNLNIRKTGPSGL
jgi:hypothetical protein